MSGPSSVLGSNGSPGAPNLVRPRFVTTRSSWSATLRKMLLGTAKPRPSTGAALRGSGVQASGMCPSPHISPLVESKPIQPAPGRVGLERGTGGRHHVDAEHAAVVKVRELWEARLEELYPGGLNTPPFLRGVGNVLDGMMQYFRETVLWNHLRWVSYPLTQAAGNTAILLVAGRPQWILPYWGHVRGARREMRFHKAISDLDSLNKKITTRVAVAADRDDPRAVAARPPPRQVAPGSHPELRRTRARPRPGAGGYGVDRSTGAAQIASTSG